MHDVDDYCACCGCLLAGRVSVSVPAYVADDGETITEEFCRDCWSEQTFAPRAPAAVPSDPSHDDDLPF